MSRWNKMFAGSFMAFAAVSLGGCNGEPNDSEMRSALGKHRLIQDVVKVFAGGDLSKTKLEKFSCVTAGAAPGYVCDFRWGTPKVNGNFEYGAPQKRRFYKAADGWMMEVN